jgi:hypothetical protein
VEAIGGSGTRVGGRDAVSVGLVIFGLYLVGIALFAVLAPGPFFDETGRFGPRNNHYIHDVAAFQGADGLLLLFAARRPTWQVPALVVASLQFGSTPSVTWSTSAMQIPNGWGCSSSSGSSLRAVCSFGSWHGLLGASRPQ